MMVPRSWARLLRRFDRRRSATFALAAFAAILGVSLGAPIVAAILGVDPYQPHPEAVYAAPSAAHLLGTDDLGRDVLARLLYGGRISLTVALVSAAASLILGSAIGVAAGYYGAWLDVVLMRLTEATMALPRLPLMILLSAVDLDKLFFGLEATRGSGASVVKLIAIIVLFGWTTAARLARASTLQLREMEFVAAARALGASDRRIIFHHIIPNALAPIIVAATLDLGELIVYESVLSFLGLGVQPPIPSWGAMLSRGMTYLYSAPLLLILPGLLTFVTVALAGLIGDALRDALDPRQSAL